MIVNIPQISELNQTCKIDSEISKYNVLSPSSLRNCKLLDLSCRFHSPAGGHHWEFHQLPHRDF